MMGGKCVAKGVTSTCKESEKIVDGKCVSVTAVDVDGQKSGRGRIFVYENQDRRCNPGGTADMGFKIVIGLGTRNGSN